MALSRIKQWKRNEVLLSTDLNNEFDNIVDNAGDATFPLTADLEVGSKLLINTGFQNPLQWHDGAHCIEGKYSSSLSVAIASIGSSRMTLVIGSAITVGSNQTIPDNVLLWFIGPGKLFVNQGVTLTINSPAQIMASTQQQVFDGTGTVSFTNPGIVSPGWWGFTSSGTDTVNKTAYNAATASLPSAGGTIIVPPGTYSVSDSLTHGNKPISVVGAHPELSIISSTADASLKHGLIFTRSHHVRNLTIKTSADLTSNRQMSAIRMDLDGVTVSGGNLANVYEHIKVRGFNVGIYSDGGDAYNIDRTYLKDIDIKVAGPGTAYVGSGMHINRSTQALLHLIQIDQNNTGEHGMYCFGSKTLVMDTVKIRNATKTESQAIKVVGNGAGADDDQAFKCWNFKNLDIADCTNGVMCTIYGTETLDALTMENITVMDVDGTNSIPGVLFVEALGTSSIKSVLMDNVTIENVGYQGMHLSTAVGATIHRATMRNVRAYNWSTSSAGTYTLFGTNGTGAFRQCHLQDIEADGNSNGRTIVSVAGQATSYVALRVVWDNIQERNTTAMGRPVSFTDADTTPSMALGRHFYANNTGATSITGFDDVVLGDEYMVEFANGNTTLVNGARIFLAGAANFIGSSHDFIRLVCTDATAGATIMKELSRSVN